LVCIDFLLVAGGDFVEILKFDDRGFTLIEIIVAIAVVGIVGTAFSGFFINSARMIDQIDEREKAIIIAQREMEILKAKKFDDILDYIDSYNNSDDSIFETQGSFPEYNVNINPILESNNLYKIELTNSWNDNQEVKLVTYISER
jgi:prepilin-type N-terminal cleavage/methylation domain-containing protein